jgi:hypothetical protein
VSDQRRTYINPQHVVRPMKKKCSTFSRFNLLLGSAFILYATLAVPAHATHVTLAWNPNSEADLAGYKVYYQAAYSLISKGIANASTIDVPLAALSDAANPRLPVSGLDENASYFFVVTAYNSLGLEGGFSNEISYESDPPPDRMTSFETATNIQMGIQIDDGGNLTRLSSLGAAAIPESQSFVFPYGIIDFGISVGTRGSAAVATLYLPESLPADQSVFAYCANGKWQSLDGYTSFNASRTQVTLTLFDGGSEDSDGSENGEISGIVALGSLYASGISPTDPPVNVPPAQIGNPGDSVGAAGGGGGGCFIAAATPSSERWIGSFRPRGFWASIGLAVILLLCVSRVASVRSSRRG